jgi:hypothetical protein
MAQPRMIQGQFGSLNYSTGVIDPGFNVPTTPSLQFNENPGAYMGVKRHNDKFYEFTPGNNLDTGAIFFMTYDYVDLRDLVETKSCMDDVTINVQRLRELPFPNLTYNMSPGNIEEAFIILLGNHNLDEVGTTNPRFYFEAGFGPTKDSTGSDSQGGLPFEVLYREIRQYVQDPSQNFLSPDQMGSQAGVTGDASEAPTRFVGNYRMSSRTIGGYPDLLVGPGLTIVRAWAVYPANRTSQSFTGGGPTDAPADELTFLRSQVQLDIPALQYNIIGTQRKLTATETATYYSNILLKQ